MHYQGVSIWDGGIIIIMFFRVRLGLGDLRPDSIFRRFRFRSGSSDAMIPQYEYPVQQINIVHNANVLCDTRFSCFSHSDRSVACHCCETRASITFHSRYCSVIGRTAHRNRSRPSNASPPGRLSNTKTGSLHSQPAYIPPL